MRHILLVADGRSAITAGWLRMLSGLDYRVSLVSTFPCDPPAGAVLVAVLPVGFSSLSGGQVRLTGTKPNSGGWKRWLVGAFRPALLAARAWLAPLTLPKYQKKLLHIINDLHPDMVHALRIPYEGMLAAITPDDIPFLASIWGNDLTLHARTSPLMAIRTRQTLERADGLLADARRDLRLSREWGLREGVPTLAIPGNGGLDLEKIQEVSKQKTFSCHSERSDREPSPLGEESRFGLPKSRPLVVNPRGFRPGSVHQVTFFKCIPLVLEKTPSAFFVCTAMQGQREAERWVKKLGIRDHVRLLPYLPQSQLWQIYARSNAYVSLSSHDGTPNTLLEALACGCFPVVGDIESLREWLTDGENGLLVDPRDPQKAAQAIITALSSDEWIMEARQTNQLMIAKRADVHVIRAQMSEFLKRFQ
jgi:glycosyltransferase involved in cell wall biosynthesis